MECCGSHHHEMPMHEGCMPTCHRRCVHEFCEKFKVYEMCSHEVVKVCSMCGFEYEAHMYPMCPRCCHHGHMMGYDGAHGMEDGY